MRRRLIDWQPHFVESRYFNDSAAFVAVHVIVAEIRNDLPQRNDVGVCGFVLREIIFVNCHLLVGRRLTCLHLQRWPIQIADE